jgi:hypothetical protein
MLKVLNKRPIALLTVPIQYVSFHAISSGDENEINLDNMFTGFTNSANRQSPKK